jgi:hypothetical protein
MKKLNPILTAALVALSLHSFAGDCAALSGQYTIGKSASADFLTVNDAVSALQCGGVTGAVTFNMESGTYFEKVVMSVIPGTSATNTVTFCGQSGVNTDVVIAYSSSNATLIMNGTNYVSFQNISVNHPAITYGNCARIDGKASHINFTGVVFNGIDAPRTGANSAVVYFTPLAPKTDITFKNCDINNGSVGIFKAGLSADEPDTRTLITGTLFLNQFETALIITNESAPVINSNVINSFSNFSNFVGISLNNVSGNITLSNNIINTVTGSVGIEMNDCVAQASNLGQIANNQVTVGGKDEASGIMLTGKTDNQVIDMNRVNITRGAETANQAYYRNTGAGRNINIANDEFFDTSNGKYTIVGSTN